MKSLTVENVVEEIDTAFNTIEKSESELWQVEDRLASATNTFETEKARITVEYAEEGKKLGANEQERSAKLSQLLADEIAIVHHEEISKITAVRELKVAQRQLDRARNRKHLLAIKQGVSIASGT